VVVNKYLSLITTKEKEVLISFGIALLHVLDNGAEISKVKKY
jgi:hypothetical protein